MDNLYPSGPKYDGPDFTRPSALFKQRVKKVIAAVALFGVVYLLLLLISVAISVALAICGFAMMASFNMFGMIGGAGCLLMGGMILYFLVKFLFEHKKVPHSYVEIFEDDQPKLFEFIRKLSMEVGTDFPKHIYLTHDVNAAVFYDSTVKSMFFPVRKNLVVGLGLVNMLNVSELKAVLAHEFGHFSQKSMRAGSYVYQVNRAIYNMLFDNDEYIDLLNRWAGMHMIFALCARITYAIVRAIQAIQRLAYKIVNRQYNLLAQQMEFHADAVAAKAAGSNNAIHALRRSDYADDCYRAVLAKYNDWVAEGLKGDNIYLHQRIVSAYVASQYRLELKNDLPLLASDHSHYKSYARVSIDDEWASHPTTQQREDALRQINVTGEVLEDSAWKIFDNVKELQEKHTHDLYATVQFEKESGTAGEELVKQTFGKASEELSLPAVYDQYFRSREIFRFDPYQSNGRADAIKDIGSFFSHNATQNMRRMAMEQDVALLDQIDNDKAQVRYFGFDGEKYQSKYAQTIKAGLEYELKTLKETMQQNDENVFMYCLQKATAISEATAKNLQNYYKQYFEIAQLTVDNLSMCSRIVALLQPCMGRSYAVEQNIRMANDLVEATNAFRSRINKIENFLADPAMHFKVSLPTAVTDIHQKEWTYISGNTFNEEELNALYGYVREFGSWTFDISFKCLKQLLELQLDFLGSVRETGSPPAYTSSVA